MKPHWTWLWCLWCLCLWSNVRPVSAQLAKPVGAYSAEGAPGWIGFGMLDGAASDAEFLAAAERSRRTGFRWVVQVGAHEPVEVPAEGVALVVRDKLARAGLGPYMLGSSYGEEWHERCLQGEFAYLGLTAHHPECGVQVYQWFSQQHARMKAVLGLPVFWVTSLVHPTRPVPTSTDFVGIDFYPQDGQRWDAVVPVLLGAEQYTTLPLVRIERGFSSTGPKQGPLWGLSQAPPDPAWLTAAVAFVQQRPRWVALLCFLWQSRPTADLRGLVELPEARAALERAVLGTTR